MPARISEEIRQKIYDSYMSGLSSKEAGELNGHSEGLCLNILKEKGVDLKKERSDKTNYIIELYNKGLNSYQIGEIVDLYPSSVCRLLKRRGFLNLKRDREITQKLKEKLTCFKCKLEKPHEDFGWNNAEHTIRKGTCRSCLSKSNKTKTRKIY